LTRRKARLILHHGEVRGYALTPTQRRYFGARASGYPPRNPHPFLAALWSGTKAGYHSYQAGRYLRKSEAHRAKARVNPRQRRTIPGTALEIRYLRSDGKRYFHPFEQHVRMVANRDGSVTLRGSKRIQANDSETNFWERYGHGRARRNPMKRRRRSSYGKTSSTMWLLYGVAALLIYPRIAQNYAVSTGGQPILPQPGGTVWYSDPFQGGGGEFFTGTVPPGAAPPWRLASATERVTMQQNLVSGIMYDAGGGLIAPAPGFLT
jgi:hypothetical protein